MLFVHLQIATNHHVVDSFKQMRPARIEVHFANDDVYLATIVASDPIADIGLLKISPTGRDPLPSFPYLKPGSSSKMRPGEPIAILGAPMGSELTVTTGRPCDFPSYLNC